MTETLSAALTVVIKSAAKQCASLNAARLKSLATACNHDQAWRALMTTCNGDAERALKEYVSAAIKPKRRKK